MSRIISLCLLLLVSQVVNAQAWRDLFVESQNHLANEDYDQALEKAAQSLDDYIKTDGEVNANYAAILRSLVSIYFTVEDFESSVAHAEKELEVRNQLGADDGNVMATTYFNLGSGYLELGEYEKASTAFSAALDLYDAVLEPGDYERIRVKWKLASSNYYGGNEEEALKHFTEGFDALATDEIDNDYLIASYDFSNLLIEQAEYEQALTYSDNLVALFEGNDLTDQELYVLSLRNLATTQVMTGKSEASSTLEKSISVIKKAYKNSPSTIASELNQWATLFQNQGKSDFASTVLAELDSGDDSDAMTLNNLAFVAFSEAKYSEAADYYVRALQSLDKSEKSDMKVYASISENMVLLLETIGDYENALKYQTEALELNIKGEAASEVIGKSESNLARVLKENDQETEALDYYLSSLKKLNQGSLEAAEAYNGLASLYQVIGEYSRADSTYRLSLSIFEGEDSRGLAAVLNNLGSFYKERGLFLQSRNYLDRALEVLEEVHGKETLAYTNALQNSSLLDLELGDYTKAEQSMQEVLTILEDLFGNGHRNYASALLNLGRVELAMGNYTEAEPAFKQALDIRSREYKNAGPFYAEALNSMAFFYQTLGNFGEAEPLFRESLQVFEKSGGKKSTNYATSLENLSTLFQLQGQFDEARPLLEEALQIDKDLLGVDHPLYSTTLHNLASLYKEIGELEQAETLFEEALGIDRKTYGENHPSYAKTLYNLATLLQDQERFEESEKLFEEVAEIRKEILGENHPDYAYSLYGLASIKRVLRKDEAFDYYKLALDKYLFQINEYFPALSEKEKSAFYEKIKPVFESFKDFAIEQAMDGNVEVLEELYNLQLSTKALLLNSSSKIRQRILNSGDQQLITAFNEWLNLKEKLVKYYNLTLEELEGEGVDLSALLEEANEVEKQISSKSQLFSREVDRQMITWESVRDALTDTEAAVEVFRIEKTYLTDSVVYAALIIHKNSPHPELVNFPYGNQLESRQFNYYRNAIKFTVGDKISFRNYWDPIEAVLGDATTIFVSSDGIFNKVSFNTLWDYHNDVYVIDEFRVRLVSNTREIVEDHPIDNMSLANRAEVFGNPDFGSSNRNNVSQTRASAYGFSSGVPSLPGTKVEVESLSTTLQSNNWKSGIFVEGDASERNFKNIESPRLLHVATHGFFMSDIKITSEARAFGIHLQNEKANPLFRSGLFFSGSNRTIFGQGAGNGEDGILTAYEAMNLNLDQTELVVMSACETGLGTIKNGEGVYGLQRAFLVAGAKSVIMSLWKVNDETTQMLMNSFYEKWLSGTGKLEAFSQAQLELKEKYPDPYHWGAFVILGN